MARTPEWVQSMRAEMAGLRQKSQSAQTPLQTQSQVADQAAAREEAQARRGGRRFGGGGDGSE